MKHTTICLLSLQFHKFLEPLVSFLTTVDGAVEQASGPMMHKSIGLYIGAYDSAHYKNPSFYVQPLP